MRKSLSILHLINVYVLLVHERDTLIKCKIISLTKASTDEVHSFGEREVCVMPITPIPVRDIRC